jgi:hypothetical protein
MEWLRALAARSRLGRTPGSGAEEYRELDDERVLVLAHVNGRGRASGLELGQLRSTQTYLFHFRDGKVDMLCFLLGPRLGVRRPQPHAGHRT